MGVPMETLSVKVPNEPILNHEGISFVKVKGIFKWKISFSNEKFKLRSA